MQYTHTEATEQLALTDKSNYLMIPSSLHGLENTDTTIHETIDGRTVYRFEGFVKMHESARIAIFDVGILSFLFHVFSRLVFNAFFSLFSRRRPIRNGSVSSKNCL